MLASCSSKKNILYFQDLNEDISYESKFIEYKLQIDDILKIDINSDLPEASLVLNPNAVSTNLANTKDALLYSGYQINTDGYVNLPSIGEVKAQGLTISEFRKILKNEIKNNKKILLDPYIDVKLLNAHFTVLGEVNMPGRYDFLKNNMTILEAIGTAGDLTIQGKRDDIKIIRSIDNTKKIINIDLTSSDLLSDINKFQVYSRDIIIVNPNTTRVKNAGIIGNSGTLISLLSFILTSIIIISNN
tara:strand:+ start:17 stop:751 length:735 start_codon:yes stop_codon:yes gene_type:complete